MIEYDEDVLIVCSPEDAEYLMISSTHPNIKDILVVTRILPVGELVVVPKDEFLEYLKNGLEG